MREYFGHTDHRGDVHVYRSHEGVRTPLPPRNDLIDHSHGFNHGYSGSGCAQLALAILADHAGDERAVKYYQDFKERVIAKLPKGEPFHITSRTINVVLSQIHAKERER